MSPIERLMLEDLRRRASTATRDDSRDIVLADGYDPGRRVAVFDEWSAFQELPVDGYRLDFAVIGGVIDSWRVAVECDGHEWHDRTKEQAEHDRKRDRYLQREGWRVMRFTGREIVRNVGECVAELLGLCASIQERDRKQWSYQFQLMADAKADR